MGLSSKLKRHIIFSLSVECVPHRKCVHICLCLKICIRQMKRERERKMKNKQGIDDIQYIMYGQASVNRLCDVSCCVPYNSSSSLMNYFHKCIEMKTKRNLMFANGASQKAIKSTQWHFFYFIFFKIFFFSLIYSTSNGRTHIGVMI